MALYKDKSEWSTKTPYLYYDRDYRKNALLKNQNLKIKIQLTFSWHGRHLGLPLLNAGSFHRPPKLYHSDFRYFFPLCFYSMHKHPTRTASKNAQRKRNTQGQVSTASKTTQHPKNVLNPGSLHYAIKWSKKIMRNVSRLHCWFYTSTTDTTQ